jgi:molybdopterin-guanine dinucleotide biosynthesis protein A
MDGADKSALVVDGASILSRVLAVLQPITPHVFAVGDRHGAAAAHGLRVVPDAIADGGALGGIYTAIVASPCERTLVVGGDMPFLSDAVVRHLLQTDGDVVMPRSPRGLEPLCAVYDRAAAAPIRARLERGERQAAVLPEGVRSVEVGPEEVAALDPDGLVFVNVNTPHDYERAVRLVKARSD